jgi:four helix bundle protein
MPGTSHRDLQIWQRGVTLAAQCYQKTASFPSDERFGLTNQIRRAACSVPANIAEGHGRFAPGDVRRFLDIANGSLTELDTHFEIAQRVGILSPDGVADVRAEIGELGRMIRAFKQRIPAPKRGGRISPR